MTIALDTTLPLFASLRPDVREPLARLGTVAQFSNGATIFQQGAEASMLYGVLDGAIRQQVTVATGATVLTTLVTKQQWTGSVALCDNKSLASSGVACGETKLVCISKADFQQLLETHPGMLWQCLSWLSSLERLLRAYMAEANVVPLEQRLAMRLIPLFELYGVRGAAGELRLGIEISQQDLGEMLGATRQRMNQLFQKWRTMGVVDTSYRRIVVNDMAGLQRIAGHLNAEVVNYVRQGLPQYHSFLSSLLHS